MRAELHLCKMKILTFSLLDLQTKQTLHQVWNEILTCNYKLKIIEEKGSLNFTFYIRV